MLRLLEAVSPSGTRTYEQAAVGASVYGEFGGRGVSFFDEVFGRTLEVGEAVLLVGQHASWEGEDTKPVTERSVLRSQQAR